MEYTEFNDKCKSIECRFGNQGRLALKQLDFSVIKCDKLLDFGAGKGLYKDLCKQYYTLDDDASLSSSFTSVSEILASGHVFDAIVANQVFEHIQFDRIQPIITGLFSILKSGGNFLATIPNINRGMYFFNNIDHKTALSYYHLAAFFELAGFEIVDAYRYTKRYEEIINASNDEKKMMEFLDKMYGLDPAQFIAVLARK